MDFYEVLNKRRTCREFTNQQVSEEMTCFLFIGYPKTDIKRPRQKEINVSEHIHSEKW